MGNFPKSFLFFKVCVYLDYFTDLLLTSDLIHQFWGSMVGVQGESSHFLFIFRFLLICTDDGID